MFTNIEMPATYEMQSEIHFLNERNIKLVDYTVKFHGKHAMSDDPIVKRWV